MVFLQAAVNPSGPAGACVNVASVGVVQLFVSEATIAEVGDVLTRPKIRKKFSTLTPGRVDEFLGWVKRIATTIPDVPEVFTLTRDPKDSKYLNLAIAAGAELVVSRDNDLLDLMTSSGSDAESFRTTHPTIRIIDPVAFLQTLPRPTGPAPDPAPPGPPKPDAQPDEAS